jgi:hypothetical protein
MQFLVATLVNTVFSSLYVVSAFLSGMRMLKKVAIVLREELQFGKLSTNPA